MLVSPNLELDEAEQVFLLQSIELGYGLQPPFYTWLQGALFHVLGPSIFALALLKNLLLFGVYASTYWAARQIFEPRQALSITLGLAFFPQILWESQRDLSHTVLLSFCIALSLGFIVKALKDGFTNTVSIGLALCVAVGLQAKYSFVVYALAMCFAFLLWVAKTDRKVSLLKWQLLPINRLGLFLLVVVLVTFPHGQWLLENWQIVQEPFSSKVRLQPEHGIGYGLSALLVASLGFIFFCAFSFAVAWVFRGGRDSRNQSWIETELQYRAKGLLFSYLATLLLLLLVLVVFFDVREMKDRWLQPFLLMLPLVLFLALPSARAGLERIWIWGGSLLLLACLLLMPGRTLFSEQLGTTSRLNIPHMKLVESVARDFPSVTVLSIKHKHEAGHFVLFGKQNAKSWRVEVAEPMGGTFVRRYSFPRYAALDHEFSESRALTIPTAYEWDVFKTEQGLEIRRATRYPGY